MLKISKEVNFNVRSVQMMLIYCSLVPEKNNRVNRDEQARLPTPTEVNKPVPITAVSVNYFELFQLKFQLSRLFRVGITFLDSVENVWSWEWYVLYVHV